MEYIIRPEGGNSGNGNDPCTDQTNGCPEFIWKLLIISPCATKAVLPN